MRCTVGFVLALVLVNSPARADESSTPSAWLRSELAAHGLDLGPGETRQIAAADASAGSAPKGRLDDFYPAAPPQQGTFDEKRLDAFYPEGARKEPQAEKKRLTRGARIGVGVGVSILVVGAAVGGGMAAAARNIEAAGE